MRLASRWFPSERMALVTGCIVTMAMLGGVLAQTPLTLLVEKFGWRQALQIDGVFGLFIIFIIMLNVRDFPAGHQSSKEEIKQIGFFRSFQLTYFKAQNWLAAFYTCLMNMPLGILGVVWGVPYLTEVHHLSATQASVVTSMIFFGTIVGGPVIGWLSDHLCMRRLPMIIGAVVSLVTVSVFLNMSSASFDQLLAIFFILGFVTSTQVLSYPTVAESNSPLLTATALSVISIITQGGIAVFESLYGRVIEHFWQGQMVQGVQVYSPHAFHEASLMIPAGFLVALLAALLLRETNCKNPLENR